MYGSLKGHDDMPHSNCSTRCISLLNVFVPETWKNLHMLTSFVPHLIHMTKLLLTSFCVPS